jgi:uncharacterized protein YjcR
MDEVRAPNYELAKKDYIKGMKYKEIASKYNVTINTVKSWKQRYDWDRKSMHTNEKCMHTNKVGAPIGNKNALGNEGGAPEENKNAEKHGFFARWLPEESFDIYQAIQQKDPLDILWDNIILQYTAIVRAQKLMFVKNQEDVTTTKIGESSSEFGGSEKWEVQQAWDKHATFLQAQSRAMKTLESMINRYDELLHKNWDKSSEEQKLRIKKLQFEVSQLSGGKDGDTGIKDFLKAIKPTEEDIKAMFADEEEVSDNAEATEEE